MSQYALRIETQIFITDILQKCDPSPSRDLRSVVRPWRWRAAAAAEQSRRWSWTGGLLGCQSGWRGSCGRDKGWLPRDAEPQMNREKWAVYCGINLWRETVIIARVQEQKSYMTTSVSIQETSGVQHYSVSCHLTSHALFINRLDSVSWILLQQFMDSVNRICWIVAHMV